MFRAPESSLRDEFLFFTEPKDFSFNFLVAENVGDALRYHLVGSG
jgi:hypothetical protein